MAFTVYKSTDASAPSLSGTNGSLVALLDACLVDGYGAKAAAGWSKAYSGANKAAYRAPSGSRLYYRVQDDGPGAGGAKEARLTGYETMSDVDTGTGPFPTAAQGVGSVAMEVIRKSTSADATARTWMVVADSRTCYLFPLTGDTAGTYYAIGFGEFYSFVPGDAYNGFVMGRNGENSSSSAYEHMGDFAITAIGGHYMARGHVGLGGSVQFGKFGDYCKGGQTANVGFIPNPNTPDGSLILAKIYITDPTTTPTGGIRGRMRGLWHWCHTYASATDADTFGGMADFAGRTFLMVKQTYAASYGNAVTVVETSDTLETN